MFSDEVYRGITINSQDQLPSACELYPQGISLGVMSKSFGCAGLRIGWVVCQDKKVLEKMANFKHYLSICNSAPSEALSLALLKSHQKILAENNQLVKNNYDLVKSYFLANQDLFQWLEPQGGCTAYPRYLGAGKIFEIADQLLQKEGVVILPDWVFEQENQHFRISFGRKNCRKALEHFSKFFNAR